MATEGEDSSFELYECQVCLHDMVDRQPRYLQCFHSFCQQCLIALLQNGEVKCPTCRKVTEVEGSIEDLTMNFHLIKMREREIKLVKKELILCQVCCKLKSVNICQDCNKKLCQECTDKHNKLKQFSEHKVKILCPKHNEATTHVCVRCVEGACVTCVMSDHCEHEEEVKDFDEGVEALKQDARRQQCDIEENLRMQQKETEELNQLGIKGEILKREIGGRISIYEKRIAECQIKIAAAKNVLLEIESNIQKEKTKSLLSNKARVDELNTKLTLMKKITDESASIFLWKYKVEKGKNKQADNFAYMSTDISAKLSTIELNLDETIPKTVPFTINDPWLIGMLEKSEEVVAPIEIVSVCHDTFVILDFIKHKILQVSEQGKHFKSYYPDELEGSLDGLSYFNGCIYVAQNRKIARIRLSTWKEETVYAVSVEEIWAINAVSDNKIIITERRSPGRIYEFNPESNKLNTVVDNVNNPCYITVAATREGIKYLITLDGDHCINVYDEDWKLETTVGKKGSGDGELDDPGACAVTHKGTVLVADWGNDRISEFQLDGSFVRHLLTSKHGIRSPMGLAFRFPHLMLTEWDSETNHSAAKCFKVAE